MLCHMVMFRFREETTAEEVAALSTALATLPARIPALVSYTFGTDLNIPGPPTATPNMDYGVVATFENLQGYETYRDDPEHQRIIRTTIAPIISERCAVQFTLSPLPTK